MKKTFFICLSIIMLALVGCKKDDNTWGKLKDGSVTIKVGETVQLHFDSNGNDYPQWSSNDEFIATVDSKGVVTGQHVGKTTVYVSNLACEVNVRDEYMDEYNDIDEPFTNWNIDYNAVSSYEKGKRGNEGMVNPVTEYVCDSTFVIDTVQIEEDSIRIDTTLVVDTVYEYIGLAEFNYIMSSEVLLVEHATYKFSYTQATDGKYSTVLKNYEYIVTDGYEDDMEQILKNRYEETSENVYAFKNAQNRVIGSITVTTEGGKMVLKFTHK